MEKEHNSKDEQIAQRINDAIKKVIDYQTERDDPPETEETLFRLIEEGFSEAEAYELIARVVSEYFISTMTSGESFDMEDYINALLRLPKPYADGPKLEG